MDLPKTVRPSRLSPHFIYGYLKSVALSLIFFVVLYGALYAAGSSLAILPFPPWLLLLLASLPLVKMLGVEEKRKSYEYEFYGDRVVVREGLKGMETVEQEDIPYGKITNVSSRTPPYEALADVGDLEVHVAGLDTPVDIIGLRHPDQYEALLMGGQGAEGAAEMRARLEELEQRYEAGEIGRAEYEQQYYYLKGKLDALEGEM